MNCDQVFEILTRGPFPGGDPHDCEVESHLENCAFCWQFALALRPASDVFEEAVSPDESRDLPGYWGHASPAAHMVADLANRSARTALAAAPLQPTPLRSPRTSPATAPISCAWTAVALVAAAVAAVIIFWIFSTQA